MELQPTRTTASSLVPGGTAARSALRRYSIVGALILMGIISTFLTGGSFAQPQNLLNIAVQVSVNGILAVGMTMVIITGGIDLGVGSLLAFIGVVVARTHMMGWPVPLMILVGLGAGALVGLWNGLFITRFSLPPFIVTLGTMTIARGIALVVSKERALGISSAGFDRIATANTPGLIALATLALLSGYLVRKQWQKGHNWIALIAAVLGVGLAGWVLLSPQVQGLPMAVVIFATVVLAGAFLLNYTSFGRHLLAIGGNAQAARLSGIDVKRTLLLTYGFMGLLSGVASVLLASRLAAGVPTAGNMGELDAIAAVVIGGTSLSGGSGTIAGTVVGAFIIGLLNNVLVIMNVESNYQFIIKGAIIMGAVMLDVRKK